MRWRRAVTAGIAMALLTGGVAKAAPRELSVSSRLQDRREVASGTRAYVEGFQDGNFYANGWHTTGEMGGVWTPPLKLLDGIWFGVNDQWIKPATKFTSGWGYTRFTLPNTDGLILRRTDFVPDGVRGAVFALQITNPGADRTVHVMVDAHSELMGAYPWGFTGVTPNASENLPDHGSFDGRYLRFTDDGALSKGPVHHYAALVGANAPLVSHDVADTGGEFHGGQGDHQCTGTETTAPMPSACSDGPFGHGTGGQLVYKVSVPAKSTRVLWVAAAGSDQGSTAAESLNAARQQLSHALHNPALEFAAKINARDKLSRWTQVNLPGNPLLQKAIDWGKQNLADLTQSADNLQIRWTNQGKQFPAPLGTVPHARWFGAGFPDYPWIFATDGEYTNFAALALGQFATAKDHLRALRDISDILNDHSGVVVHETVSDGSVWFGHDSQTTNADGTKTNDFNTDETIKFPSAVALVWRWTGDNAFRDQMYDFAKRNLHYVQDHLTGYHGWPTGSGNVERTGMGPIKLDNAVYYIRALLDLADMAQSKGDTATVTWARGLARDLRSKFEGDFWDAAAGQYADSLLADGTQNLQKHWIGEVPAEAELVRGTRTVPGVASQDHGTTALAARENSCFSGSRPGSQGLFHTGCGGGFDGKGDTEIFGLTTAIMAVGEGNYGRLGSDQQVRYTNANAETMFSEPATGNTPDEQPGAMPEIFPSTPDPAQWDGIAGVPPNIDRCWTCRSMVMQAWDNYGTAWPVVHQQLGVRPFLGNGRLDIVPQVPAGQTRVQGSNIRLGDGSVDVLAVHSTASRYSTTVTADGISALQRLRVGATLPRGASVARVLVDGTSTSSYRARETNRGLEVTTRVRGSGPHAVIVVAG
jgi:hypothetical protein